MADFLYRAKQGPDRLIEGEIEAMSETAAIEKIHQMGYVPIEVRAKSASARSRGGNIRIWKSKTQRNRDVIFFSRHLASLIKSGVPILTALHLLGRQEKDATMRTLIHSLAENINAGSTLTKAMEKFPVYFSPVYLGILSAGENSGSLPEALVRISQHLKKEDLLRSKLRRAMTYPILLAIAGFLTIFFILTFVIPKLAFLFANFNRTLPLATRVLITLGDWMSHYWAYAGLVFCVSLLAIPAFFRRAAGKPAISVTALRLPFFGKLVFKNEMARFARTLEMSLSDGLPFLQSLTTAIPTLDNLVLRQLMKDCRDRIQKGERFGRSLAQYSAFPSFVTDLISVGEETGHLEEVLIEIADSYEQDLDEATVFMTTLLEPAMILIVGSFVAFIVLAMVLPIIEMNTMF